MEPDKIKDLKTWWGWIKKHPWKALAYFILLILVILILIPVVTGFFGEKGKQLAEPASPFNSSTQPKNQQAEKQTADIHQTATGHGNVQLATTGDNSPIIINVSKEELSHQIQAKQIYSNKSEDNLFVTRIELSSQHPIPNVYFEAHAKTITEFAVYPKRSGMSQTGHSGKREGYWFTNIPNFFGKYLLIVKTKDPEKINIKYNTE